MMHVAPSCTVLTDSSPIRSVFIDEGRPRASVRIDGIEFLIDQAWPDDGEFDFAGFISGSLKCHLKITRDEIYLDDDRGEHGTSVWSIGDVKELVQNM